MCILRGTCQSEIKEPIIFIALKRVCKYLVDNVWYVALGSGEIEAEFKLAKERSKRYRDDVIKLANLDTTLNWGQKKSYTKNKHWFIAKHGDFNPWYSGNLSLENFLDSIESIVEFTNSIQDYIEGSEFIHYYSFLRRHLDRESKKLDDSFWDLIHKDIRRVSESKFKRNDFTECVRVAFVEIEDIVRSICKRKTGAEYLDNDLMHYAFSPNNPIIKLGDLSTRNGKSIQAGYMEIFSGALKGIRNPKSHKNFQIDEIQAIHFLFLASLLMTRLDMDRI